MPSRLGDSVPFLLNRAMTRFSHLFARQVEEHGVTLPMWRVLAVLDEQGEMKLGRVARLTCIELSTLSRIAAGLEGRGLIRRWRCGSDARAVLAGLTVEGCGLVATIRPHADACEHTACSGMSAAELDTLRRLLGRLSDEPGASAVANQ